MDALDLSKRPPRSPRVQVDGLYMLARTIDKLRAMQPGGNLGGYRIPGMSHRLLDGIGINADDLFDVVAQAFDDDDVAAWVRAHADTAKYSAVNEALSKRSTSDLQDPARFNELYPWARGSALTNIFDIMEEDDRRSFSARE